jgi:phenylpropionate dioxygenase-like ring-hydroxylating dioxygenase large terminal subunit
MLAGSRREDQEYTVIATGCDAILFASESRIHDTKKQSRLFIFSGLPIIERCRNAARARSTTMDQRFIDRMKKGFDFERSREAPPPDFPALPPIPGGRYTDPEFLDLEMQQLWRKSWLYACHLDELPEAGSYLSWNKTGSPIVILRGHDAEVRAFYNVCRHRGGPLVTDVSGSVRNGLTCNYHGWRYDLEGNLQALRDRRDFGKLDTACLGLVTVRCERFGKWVFLNEDPAAPALVDSLGPVASHWQQLSPGSLRHVASYGFDIACNMKVMLEAFLEVYHLGNVHPQTANRFLDHRATRITLWPNGHSLMVTPNRDPEWIDPGTVGMDLMPGMGKFPLENNLSYHAFPNLVTPIAPTGFPFLTFWPTGPCAMRVDCHWFAPDWGDGERHPQWDQRIENFNRILAEDMELVPRIQQSLESPGFLGGRLSYQERRIYHWHEELDRRLNAAAIPPHLRLEPKLAEFFEHEPPPTELAAAAGEPPRAQGS